MTRQAIAANASSAGDGVRRRAGRSSGSCPRRAGCDVWVWSSTLPETIFTAPNSPSERASDRTTPYTTAHLMPGRVIRQKVVNPPAPRLRAACSWSSPISVKDRDHLADDQRQRDEHGRHDHAGRGEDDLEADLLQGRAEPAVPAVVDEQQRQADDDGRDRERHVDERAEQPLAPELVADQQQRDAHAEHQVDEYGEHGERPGQLERVDHRLVGERVDHGAEAVGEGVLEDQRGRPGDQEEDIGEGDDPQPPATGPGRGGPGE